jgi:hypothetical protein
MAIKVANNQSLTAITSIPAVITGGAMTLLATETASSSSTIQFTSGIDDTYKEYQIHFMDVHPSGDGAELQVNFRDGSTAYDASKTSTFFMAQHSEADATSSGYEDGFDLANGTGFQYLNRNTGNDNDQATSGILTLYDPSNTTFVKHFISRTNTIMSTDKQEDAYVAGYCNTTSAIDGVQFKFASGNIDAGTFKLYGIS